MIYFRVCPRTQCWVLFCLFFDINDLLCQEKFALIYKTVMIDNIELEFNDNLKVSGKQNCLDNSTVSASSRLCPDIFPGLSSYRCNSASASHINLAA